MKKKKFLMYFIIIFLILLVIGMGYLIYINVTYNENEIEFNEYTPEQEISDEQLRETVIKLYFLNKETNELEEEKREIDSKNLLENPYKYLVELLIEGPKNENLKKLIPEGITIIGAEIENGIVTLKFSNNFMENQEINDNEIIMNSIEKTLKELNEVEKIEIINSEE